MGKVMKAAVIIFHKNIDTYYPREWWGKCYSTIRNQYNAVFDVFELDYGGTGRQTYPGSNFRSEDLKNHASAHNYLLDWVFSLDYDCAFNVNVDDWYALGRFEIQLPYIEKGYDVVSSNFYRVNDDESVKQAFTFHNKDMVREAAKEHNILAHPVLCYSRNFWLNCDKLDPKDIPFDDFILWKKSYKRGCFKFIILPDYLLFQRIHENNVSRKGQWKTR
jgi:hypothetical protein